MAGPRRRGSGAAGHHSDRNRNERHSAAGFAALDFALRPLFGADELRVRRRPLLRARAGLRAGGQCDAAQRAAAFDFAAVQPQRLDLPLRSAEPRPLAAGSENIRGLGAGAPLPLHSGRGRRFRLRRHHHAIPGAARSQQAVRLRRHRAAGVPATGQQQRQCGRRLLFAGRPVLLHPRPGPGARYRGHRQHRAAGKERHSGLRERHREGADRPRAAAGAVRIHEAGRGRGGRHPDARRRAGAGDPAQASRP